MRRAGLRVVAVATTRGKLKHTGAWTSQQRSRSQAVGTVSFMLIAVIMLISASTHTLADSE